MSAPLLCPCRCQAALPHATRLYRALKAAVSEPPTAAQQAGLAVLQLMAARCECQLHSRLPKALAKAQEAALQG